MDENREQPINLEQEPQHPEVVVASATFYKNWYPGELRSEKDTDKVRGDIAIESLGRTARDGYRVIDVDGGNNPDFTQALRNVGVSVVAQREPGYSQGRREGIELALQYNPKAIFSTEPEKPSMMGYVGELAKPIIDGQAEIVFAQRDPESFDTYPPVQARFEQKSNKAANDILRARGILPKDSPDLDWWMGPRMIKNDPEVLKLFETKYDFEKFDHGLDKTINLELWPNTLYIPVVMALAKGMRVASVPIHYEHPQELTQNEVGDPAFDRKREVQYRGIITAMIEAVRKIELESGKSEKPTRLIA